MRMGSAYVFTGVTGVTLTLYKPDTSLRRTDMQARSRRCPSSRELTVSSPISRRGN